MELIIICALFWGGSFLAAHIILTIKGMWRAGFRIPAIVEVVGIAALIVLALM